MDTQFGFCRVGAAVPVVLPGAVNENVAALAGLAELELIGLVERRPGRGFVRRSLGARGE